MQARLVATVVIRVVVVSVDFKCPTITKAKGQTRPYVSGEVPVKGEGTVTGAPGGAPGGTGTRGRASS